MVTTRPVCAPCVRICMALPRRRQPIILILCPAPGAIALRELFYILGRLCHAAVALRFRDLLHYKISKKRRTNMFNRKSIYALNKKDPNAIVYTDADGMRRLFDTFSQMRNTQAIHCGRKHIPAIHFPQPGIKILGSMNSFMRWGLILQLSQKKPLSRHSNWRRNGNPLTGRSSGVNHIHYPRKYHAVTAAALIAEKNKYPRRIGAVENMIHP